MSQLLFPFSKIGFGDSELGRLESNIENSFNPILSKEILEGSFLQNIALTTGVTNKVSHGLQRPVNGYIVVKKSADSVVYDSELTNTNKGVFLELLCSADTIVSLWVF